MDGLKKVVWNNAIYLNKVVSRWHIDSGQQNWLGDKDDKQN